MRVAIAAIVWALAVAPGLAQTPDAAAPSVEQAPAQPPTVPPEAAPGKIEPVPGSQADRAAVAVPGGRFSFQPVDGGLLRLDSQSGQVAFCGPRTAGWTCQPVPEERAALEAEIARLQDDLDRLRRDTAALRETPPRPPAEVAPSAKPAEPGIKLPRGEDLERTRAAIEDAWQRLMEMIVNLQRDIMRKG